MTVKPLGEENLDNVPFSLRKLADDIDAGKVKVDAMILLYENDGDSTMDTFGDMDLQTGVWLLNFANFSLMLPTTEDD